MAEPLILMGIKPTGRPHLGNYVGMIRPTLDTVAPTPSRADVRMTQSIVDVAKPLGISVHDHIIVGKDGHTSLKGLRLI